MGCMGNPDVQTPHIDRLAREGVLLPNTFANTPVCCSARACMLTGKYSHRHGLIANDLRLRESEQSVAELFQDNGYRTGFIGKWHLDGGKRMPGFVPPGPRRQGFDFWAANQCSHKHFDTQYFRDTEEPIPIERFEVEAWADLTIEFLKESKDRPFFLTVAMGPPHDPYDAPEKYEKLYDPERLQMRPNWKEGVRRAERKDIAKYYAAVTAIDDQIGRMMSTLDELGLREDTIVLFTSDHGDMLGSQGTWLKRKPWEESIRVPGIVRYPARVDAGRVSEAMFSHVDYAPTLLSLCGIDPPTAMQGTDISKAIVGEGDVAAPESVFFQLFGPYKGGRIESGWRGVRTARYMYARTEKAPWVLYDLEKDPYELKNLADDPAAASIQKEMERTLADWMAKTGDSWDRNWTEFVEDKGRLYRFGTFYTVDEYLTWAKEHSDLAP